MKKFSLSFYLFSIILTVVVCSQNTNALPTNQIKLPPGFNLEVYAQISNARQLTLGEDGIVFVGTSNDRVYALIPNGHSSAKVVEIAKGLNHPNGVAYRQGTLFVAEIDRILKFEQITSAIQTDKKITPKVVIEGLPKYTHHGLRYIKFGPDGLLYMGIGMPCNICLRKEKELGTISRIRSDGSHFEVYARGIRNSMGFDWDPMTKGLWFTDNGTDLLGDNFPPDELNSAPIPAMHFGFPFYNANQPDMRFYGDRDPHQVYTPPLLALGPHVAALGMTFYTGSQFPREYHKNILIAEHGSWNRSLKIGYRITRVTFEGNKPKTYQPFITGWLQDQVNWGRPVDLLVLSDGSILISDDYAGVIYRVTYRS